MSKLNHLNEIGEDNAIEELTKCCASQNWATRMAKLRPFSTLEETLEQSDKIWFSLTKEDWLEAFKGHPQIGNIDTLREKYKSTKDWSKNEQAGVDNAGEETIQELAKYNEKYLKKFGYIFIVCATGKTADEMLALLKTRMDNDPDDELLIAAREQSKITKLRLEKAL